MMSLIVCIDANLALKLVLDESDSDFARLLWEDWAKQQATLVAPVLWGYEVLSVIRNCTHRGKHPSELEAQTVAALHQLPVQLLQPTGLFQRAWELAREFDRPAAYDSHYLALAEIVNCPLWTADKRLYNAVHPRLNWVHWLGNYQPIDDDFLET